METTLRRSGRQHSAHTQARDDELSVQPLTARRRHAREPNSPEMADETAVTEPPILVVSDTESEDYTLAGTQQLHFLLEPDSLLLGQL
jgi:hypothetical protein